jgi:MATE family multidrug resistance protein
MTMISAMLRPDMTDSEMTSLLQKLAAPSILSLLLVYVTQTVTVSFVGHRLGFAKLAQFSVGLSVYNILGAAVGMGFASALDTLAPQAFGRNRHTKELVVLFQRSFIISATLCVIIALIFYNSEWWLTVVFGPTLAPGAAEFLRTAPPYGLLIWIERAFCSLFPAHRLPDIPMKANIAGIVASVAVNYTFLTEGSSIGQAVWLLFWVELVIVGLLCLAAQFHPKSLLKEFWRPVPNVLNVDAMKGHLRLGFASMTECCLEWWAFELLQVVCAQIGDIEVAAYTIFLNIMWIYYSVSYGISFAGATAVGNSLGANQPELAARFFKLTLKLSATASAATVASLLLFGGRILQLYTDDVAVLKDIEPYIPLLALWHAIDASRNTMVGLFRGVGKQEIIAKRTLLSMWGVGLPLACAGVFVFHWGLVGVLCGQLTGMVAMIPLLVLDVWRWDWPLMARTASHDEQWERDMLDEEPQDAMEGDAGSPPEALLPALGSLPQVTTTPQGQLLDEEPINLELESELPELSLQPPFVQQCLIPA